MTGWFLGAVLSGLALPGVALAGALPATAPAPSPNDAPSSGGAPPAAPAVSPATPPAPAPAAAAGAAPPVPSPAPPYAPPPPGSYGYPPPGYYGYPPPAYYGYPPPGYLPPLERLAVLDAQIRDLQMRHDDISLAVPLVLLIGGGAVGAVGLGIYEANRCSRDGYGNRVDPTCQENGTASDRGAGMLLVGGVAVVFGATSLIIRTARRRHIARQIEARQVEANALRAFTAPRWGVSPVRNGGGMVSLALDF